MLFEYSYVDDMALRNLQNTTKVPSLENNVLKFWLYKDYEMSIDFSNNTAIICSNMPITPISGDEAEEKYAREEYKGILNAPTMCKDFYQFKRLLKLKYIVSTKDFMEEPYNKYAYNVERIPVFFHKHLWTAYMGTTRTINWTEIPPQIQEWGKQVQEQSIPDICNDKEISSLIAFMLSWAKYLNFK